MAACLPQGPRSKGNRLSSGMIVCALLGCFHAGSAAEQRAVRRCRPGGTGVFRGEPGHQRGPTVPPAALLRRARRGGGSGEAASPPCRRRASGRAGRCGARRAGCRRRGQLRAPALSRLGRLCFQRMLRGGQRGDVIRCLATGPHPAPLLPLSHCPSLLGRPLQSCTLVPFLPPCLQGGVQGRVRSWVRLEEPGQPPLLILNIRDNRYCGHIGRCGGSCRAK